MEAACDEAAVRGQSPAARSAYCESILRFAMQGRGVPGSLAFGQGSAKTRIVHLLHYRRLGAGAMVVCAVVIAASMTACMVRPTLENAPAATPETAEAAEPEATPTPAPTQAPAAVVNTAQVPLLEDPDNSPLFIDPVPDYKYISRFMNNGHRGDDLCADPGTDVLAAADGVVVQAAEHYSFGNFVVIDHGTNGEGYSWRTLYAHLQSYTVEAGQHVIQGQIIGYVGSTGRTTGNQCHFEVYVDNILTSPRWFTAYHGEGDSAEPTDEERQELIEKRLIKRLCKVTLYELLKGLTGQRPPWGSLTGIRPTRLIYEGLADGLTMDEACVRVEQTFDVLPEKVELLREIVEVQRTLPEPGPEEADLRTGRKSGFLLPVLCRR